MIHIGTDELLTFAEVAKRLPPSRTTGKHIHLATIHRWRRPGVKNIRLEAVRIGGGMWCTTWTAVQCFIDRLSEIDHEESPQVNETAGEACESAGF